MKEGTYYWLQKCSSGTLVSGSVGFGFFSGESTLKDDRVIEMAIFSTFCLWSCMFGTLDFSTIRLKLLYYLSLTHK